MATSTDNTYSTSTGGYSGINLLATKMFSQHLGIQFGLGGDSYNYGINNNDNSPYANSSDVFSTSYLIVPVRALYFSNSKKKVGFYATAGLDFGILEGATDQEGDDLSSYFNPIVFSTYVSCGVELRNASARGIWMFGPFYKTTLSNFYSGNGGNTWMNDGNNGNLSSVGISITYMSKFGRF